MNINTKLINVLKEDVDAMRTAIEAIRAKLPDVATLDKTEARRLSKYGTSDTDFIIDAGDAVKQFPEVFPVTFKSEGFISNVTSLSQINELIMQFDSIAERMKTLLILNGSETKKGALKVYKYLEAAQDEHPGLKSVVAKLAERFKGQGKRKSKPQAGEADAAK